MSKTKNHPPKVLVSISIVAYRAKDALESCLVSLVENAGSLSFEVLIVDNDPAFGLNEMIQRVMPEAVYLPQKNNLGFGAGHNLAAAKARGEFIFFLNPDTEVPTGVLEALVEALQADEELGVVAPGLLDPSGNYLPTQGATLLTPLTLLGGHSFLNNIPNPIASLHWYRYQDFKQPRIVEVVPGTALMMRKEVFDKVGRFDERFFLYFEEYDLCQRLKQLGYTAKILGNMPIMHHWAASTNSHTQVADQAFIKSRKLYLNKYYPRWIADSTLFLVTLRWWQWLLLLAGLGALIVTSLVSVWESFFHRL